MILLSLSIVGFVLSIILLYFNARKFPASIYLGVLFFFIGLYSIVQWVFYYSASTILVAIFYTNFSFLAYLIGPVNYWYVRSMINDNYRLKNKDLWHLVPSLIVLLTLIPYMLTPWTEKMRVASGIIDNLYYLIVYEPTIIHRLFRVGIIYLSRDLHIFIYLLFTIPLFVGYFKQARKKNVLFGQRYMIKWLIIFQIFFFLMVAGHIMVMSYAISMDEPDLVYAASKLQLIAIIGLTGLLISPLFFPEILYGLPRIPNHYLDKGNGRNKNGSHHAKKHIAPLESDYLRLIEQKVDQCMTENQPYIEKEFNLPQLSVLIHIPVHHLGYFFREEKKQSFTSYRNRWRVEYAKILIDEGKAKEMTLEAIGLLSGFANRNSFIIAFKREEGIPPHEYVSHIDVNVD